LLCKYDAVKTNEPISLQIGTMVNGAKGYFGGQEVKGQGRIYEA